MTISFATRDGTVLPAHEVALGIYLLMLNEPQQILDRMWKFIEPNVPTDRRAQFEANFLERMQLYSEAATLRVLERIPVTWKRSLHVGSNWCILAG
jgi:hypothetical protein